MLNPHGSALFQRIAEMGITVRQIQTQRLANTQEGTALTFIPLNSCRQQNCGITHLKFMIQRILLHLYPDIIYDLNGPGQ